MKADQVTDRDNALWISAAEAEALVTGTHGNPFAVLGPHEFGSDIVVRAYLPGALSVELVDARSGEGLGAMEQPQVPGLFVGRLPDARAYRLRIRWSSGVQEVEDTYAFGPQLGEMDL